MQVHRKLMVRLGFCSPAGAVIAGLLSSQAVRGALLYDNITGIENGSAGGYDYSPSGDSYVGGAYVLPAGSEDLTGFDLLLKNTSSTTFTGIKIYIFVWGAVNTTGTVNAATPAFSDELGIYQFGATVTLRPGQEIHEENGQPGTTPSLPLATPLQLNGDTIIGLTFNVQGTTNGLTYTSVTGLTTLFSSGAPPTAGQNLFDDAFYLNLNGETNGNFTGGPYTSSGFTDLNFTTRVFGDIAAEWNANSGGAWETASNWAANAVPSSTTDAAFNLSSSGYTVTVSSADVTFNLNSNSSSLGIINALTVGESAMAGGSLIGVLKLTKSTATRLNVSAGSVAVGGNGGTGSLSIGSGINLISAGAVSIGANSTLTISRGGELLASAVSIAGTTNAWTGKLDIGTAALDLPAASLATITNQIAQGYNAVGGGNWNGSAGITSGAAAGDSTHRTAVGTIVNNNGLGSPLYGAGASLGMFGSTSPALNDVLIRYTWSGDANLNGKVDGTDYSLIDNGALNHLSGWYNGDFNYDGIIDGSDYTLIDNSYNIQGAALIANAAATTAQVATDNAPVPEPVCLSAILSLALLGRRRRIRYDHHDHRACRFSGK
jgi:hypothetical protein